MITIARALACLAAVALPQQALSADLQLMSSIDLHRVVLFSGTVSTGIYSGASRFPSFDPIEIRGGDTLTWNIDFLGDQYIHVEDLKLIRVDLSPTTFFPVTYTEGAGTMEILGTDGLVIESLSSRRIAIPPNIGQAWSKSDFTGLSSPVDIGGLRFTFAVDNFVINYNLPYVPSRTFGAANIQFRGHRISLAGDTGLAIPEPGTWALMIIGFAAAGSALRRRRSFDF